MFLICEEVHRYLGNYYSDVILGYVNTEDEAKKICSELNLKAEERNKSNSMGFWRYYFKPISYINSIDDVKA